MAAIVSQWRVSWGRRELRRDCPQKSLVRGTLPREGAICMPNVNAVLPQEISRLSKRVVNISTKVTRRLVTQHRRDIAALKRQVHGLTQRLASVEKTTSKSALMPTAPPELLEKARFRADGLRSHRAKLGLSAKNYGKLVGVAGITIYKWEARKSKPRQAQVAKLIAVRGFGRSEERRVGKECRCR